MADAAAEGAPAGERERMEPRSGRLRNAFLYEGRFDFEIRIDELIELDDILKVGPMVLLQRLAAGQWRLPEVEHVLRLGLTGAGMEPEKAHDLVRRALKPGYYAQAALVAAKVMQAVLYGSEDDTPGESTADPADQGGQTSRTDGSASPSSSD